MFAVLTYMYIGHVHVTCTGSTCNMYRDCLYSIDKRVVLVLVWLVFVLILVVTVPTLKGYIARSFNT